MAQAGTTVNPTTTGSIERRERRYQKLVVTIERTQRRFEKADKTAQRLLRSLAKLERKRRAAEKALARAKAEAANDLVNAVTSELVTAIDQAEAKPADVTEVTELTAAGGFGITLDDGLEPPAFLKDAAAERNRKPQAMADPKTKEKKAERKVVERQVRDAELTGKRRKMPPTGKAALARIRSDG